MTRDEVQRYDIEYLSDDGEASEMALRPNGDYVLHEDHIKALAEVEEERDQMERMYRHHVNVALFAIDTLNQSQAIVAALREPSEAVIVACAKALRRHHEGVEWCTWEALKEQTRQRMMDEVRIVLSAAVAAAEKEAQA